MLIKLLPAPPHPSVLFNITFEDLPDGLALPQTWTTHLSNLMHDELPMPRYHHALDKASFLPCIIEEVVFDMPALLVTCRFIDGSIEQWKIDLEGLRPCLGAKCYKALESVVDDVYLSTLQSERERERERQKEKERELEREKERLRLLQQASPSSSIKSFKHKKKRSLLMTIVSSLSSLNSIINLSLPSPTISTLPPSPSSTSSLPSLKSPSPLQTVHKPEIPAQEMCPRFLRRRARSSLVDAFRLYILHELNQRLPQGGYYVWVLHSLLKEARERRDAFLAKERELERQRERERERLRLLGPPPPYLPSTSPSPSSNSGSSSSSAGSGSAIIFGRRKSNPKHTRGPSIETEAFSATTSSEPPTSDDELDELEAMRHARAGSDETQYTDGDTETIETDTDGSSIQTPTSSHFTLPLPTSLPSIPASQDLTSLMASPISILHAHGRPQSHSPTSQPHPADIQLQTLTHLILLHTSHSARTAHDESTRLDALEVRGRRRAWLNRALCHNGLRLTAPPGGRLSTNVQRMEIGMGAGYGGLGFAVPIRRSSLGMWVVNAEDVDLDVVGVQGQQVGMDANPGQRDAIMLEEDEVRLVGGERFTGYDERNGVEPKRTKIPVPSKGAQLFPVNELEEEEDMALHRSRSNMLSRSPDSTELSDEDDSASIKFGNLNLNQYDDLRELQMDLDIVTGVGFDMMDSSDEEDADADLGMNIPSTSGPVGSDMSEGGICVALDIPRPKALHARSAHLLSGHEQRQKQRRQQPGGVTFNEGHSVHEYPYPDSIPQRCSTPTPPLSPPTPGSMPESLGTSPQTLDSAPPVAPIPIPKPAYFCTPSPVPPAYTVGSSGMSPSTVSLVSSPNSHPFNSTIHPPSPTKYDLESGVRSPTIKPERKHVPCDVHVNEMGELVSGMDGMDLGGGEEFTLAMDLPSKTLSSRFSGMSFAAIGQTKSFKGRVRGASRVRGSHSGVVEECAIVEDLESGSAWA